MDITTKLEDTNKKLHTILMKTVDYCVNRDCSVCILDNHSAWICTTTFIRRINNKIKSLKEDNIKWIS